MTMHQLMLSSEEIKVFRQLLDMAVRQGGMAAAPAAVLIMQRLEMAERAPLPLPKSAVMPDAESHGAHFPPEKTS